MRPSLSSSAKRASAGQLARLFALVLILMMALTPAVLLGEGGGHTDSQNPARAAKRRVQPLTEEERAEHALNRLTFGPRPGEVEQVRAMGVDKWIALQLHPEQIDDSALEARLQNYPAMQLPLPDLIADLPSAAIIRAVANGRIGLPQNQLERAIYRDQVADFDQRKQRQAEEAEGKRGSSANSVPPPEGAQASQPMTESKSEAMSLGMNAGNAAGSGSLQDKLQENTPQTHGQRLSSDPASTAILNLPPDQRLNRLVEMKPQEFRGFMKSLNKEERLELTEGMTPQQKEISLALVNPTLVVSGELMETRLLTDIYSQRQLQAVMTDFWLNHFNVYIRKGQFAPWYLVDFERNVIAPRAMGRFEDLLVATAQSPAMLFYLDNAASIGPNSMAAVRARMNPRFKNRSLGLNENYGRELMELHTVGVDSGYTQKDVTEASKVLTGWTLEPQRAGGGGFIFDERRHEPGTKYVLGHKFKEHGEQEGLDLLHMLATSPATAHHLSQQLAVRFVSDNPPPALVDRMARTYLKTDGDIRQVLRTMFTSPEFWSRDAYRAKVKTPEEFVISAVRATGGEVLQPLPLLSAIQRLGMPLYGCPTPNGYPWTAAAWVNTGDLLDRMNIALALAAQNLGAVNPLDALMKIDAPDALPAAEKETRLEDALLQGKLPPPMRDAVLHQVDGMSGPSFLQRRPLPKPGRGEKTALPRRAALVQMIGPPASIPRPADKQAAMIAGLLLGSPEFQKR